MINDVVIVHSCHCKVKDLPDTALVKEVNYLRTKAPSRAVTQKWDPEVVVWCRPLPVKCKCRKRIPRAEANEYVEIGRAQLVYRFKDGALINTLDSREYGGPPLIWMPVERGKTPRVDLITAADIERAYVDGLQKYVNYIQMVHQLYLDNRAALMVPFIPDPFEGRPWFTTGSACSDGRTEGGHGRDVSPAEMAYIKGKLNA